MRLVSNQVLLDYSSVLLRPRNTVLTSRSQVNLIRAFNQFPNCRGIKWQGVPVMVANMDTTGTFEVHNEVNKYGMLTMLHKHYPVKNIIDYYKNHADKVANLGISTGIADRDIVKLREIQASGITPTFINIDVANGYMVSLTDYTKQIRAMFPQSILIAGNVVTGDRTKQLITEGLVDIVKVGIGPGAACLTRQKAGVGIPQLSAVDECAIAAHEVGGYIIADGGITCPGDMAKAFCAGADFVMCGSVFAGHYENPGEMIEENGRKYKMFYGMSSGHAMKKYAGKKAEYRSSEGRVIKVPLKGHIKETIEDYLGGVRSCCTYINAASVVDMPECGDFVLVQNQLNTSLVRS